MITPEEFPYITGIHVNDCYTYKDFDIQLNDYRPFSHLILTGKNGSGKSTILRAINQHIISWRKHEDPIKQAELISYTNRSRKNLEQSKQNKIFELTSLLLFFSGKNSEFFYEKDNIVLSHLKTGRGSHVDSVSTATKDSEFYKRLSDSDTESFFVKKFKQYLVNKKIKQAFDQLNNELEKINESNIFFFSLTNIFRRLFEDNKLLLEFVQEDFEFFIRLSDSRQITFDSLSDGLSACISIIMDLLTRVDLIRKQVGNNSYQPCGIVMIDEPETHLHLELQEEVMPLLTELFPNIQFIVATHSPAVIASIRNATIFDLTTKEIRISEETVGRSYAELTTSHFGLDNNYSTIADEIVRKINQAESEYRHDPEALKSALEIIVREQGPYLSPTLRVEMELLIAKAEAKQAVVK